MLAKTGLDGLPTAAPIAQDIRHRGYPVVEVSLMQWWRNHLLSIFHFPKY